jgi:hypothetical protein
VATHLQVVIRRLGRSLGPYAILGRTRPRRRYQARGQSATRGGGSDTARDRLPSRQLRKSARGVAQAEGVREQREGRSVVSEAEEVDTVVPPRVYSGPTRRDSRERFFWQQAGRQR